MKNDTDFDNSSSPSLCLGDESDGTCCWLVRVWLKILERLVYSQSPARFSRPPAQRMRARQPTRGEFCPSNIARLLLSVVIIVMMVPAIGFWLYHSSGHGTSIEQSTYSATPTGDGLTAAELSRTRKLSMFVGSHHLIRPDEVLV
jgi:hypothetical protein